MGFRNPWDAPGHYPVPRADEATTLRNIETGTTKTASRCRCGQLCFLRAGRRSTRWVHGIEPGWVVSKREIG